MKRKSLYKFLFSCGLLLLVLPATIQSRPGSNDRMPRSDVFENIKNGRVQIEYVPGQLIIGYQRGVAADLALQTTAYLGAIYLETIASPPGAIQKHLVKIPPGKTMAEAITLYSRNPNVLFVEPNYISRANQAPNDTSYDQLWGLNNSAQFVSGQFGTSGIDIDAQIAWNTLTDCSSVIVAVSDSGLRLTHEDFAGNLWNGASCVDDNNNFMGGCNAGYDYVNLDLDPSDENGHGSHVAGIIGAAGNNSLGVTGICWNVQLMAVRGLDATGAGLNSDLIKTIYFAINNGADIINASWGSNNYSAAVETAIADAQAAGVLVVTSAGNGGADGIGDDTDVALHYPSGLPGDNIIGVSAHDNQGNLTAFSNYGATTIDIAAPGSGIKSTYHGTLTTTTDSLTSGWTFSNTSTFPGGWGYDICSSNNSLTNPTDFCNGWWYYNNADDRVYKNFNLSGYDSVQLNFDALVELETNFDFFNVNYKASGGDPFSFGTNVLNYSVDNLGVVESFLLDISGCNSSTCSIGFQLDTDPSNSVYGVGVFNFSLIKFASNNTTYDTQEGTSQAAPHVSGVAALLKARNPNFLYSDLRDAIYWGGESEASLTGTSTTGKRLNAANALKYIPKTVVVSAVSP